MNGPHPQRVLRGDRRNHRRGITAQCRDGLYVRLNARAAARIRSGNTQYTSFIYGHCGKKGYDLIKTQLA